MALNAKDWAFIHSVIEEAGQALYDRGYKDSQAKKEKAKPEKIVLSPAAKMKLQTLYNVRTQGK